MESTDLVAVAERREAMAVEAFATLQHGASVEELARVLRTVLDGSVVSGVGAEQVSAYADTWVQMHERAVPTFSEFIGLFNGTGIKSSLSGDVFVDMSTGEGEILGGSFDNVPVLL